MCSACRFMVFNILWSFVKICQGVFNLFNDNWEWKLLTQRAITLKVGKPELRYMCSARRLMVFNVCVKFHENMSSGFKVMERTWKLLTDTHTHTCTQKRRKLYTPMAYFLCRGYNCTYCSVWVCMGFNQYNLANQLPCPMETKFHAPELVLKKKIFQ